MAKVVKMYGGSGEMVEVPANRVDAMRARGFMAKGEKPDKPSLVEASDDAPQAVTMVGGMGEEVEVPKNRVDALKSRGFTVKATDDSQKDDYVFDPENLQGARRKDLDRYAAELEIADPEKLPNKDTVIEAIEAKRSESDSEAKTN